MTLNQLRTFLAVAETGSVRAAAQQLVVTQAAVSASLAALQKSLGVPLLAPDGRGLRLTEAGQAYAGYVRRILGLLDEAGRAAAGGGRPGARRAAYRRGDHGGRADRARATGRLPVPASRHGRSAGGGEPGAGPRAAGPASGGSGAGRPPGAGLGRAGAGRPAAPARRGGRARLAASARPGAQLVPWLAGQPWLLREPGSGTRAATDVLLAELDIAPPTLMVGSNGAIRGSASVGLGVTLVSRDAVAAELADGRLTELPVPGTPLHRDWYLVAHPGPVPRRAAGLVAHMLRRGGFRPPTVNRLRALVLSANSQ